MKYRVCDASGHDVAETEHPEDAGLVMARWGFGASIWIKVDGRWRMVVEQRAGVVTMADVVRRMTELGVAL